MNKNEMDATLEEMRSGSSRAGLTPALSLTDEVRLDPDDVRDILDQLRASASPATN